MHSECQNSQNFGLLCRIFPIILACSVGFTPILGFKGFLFVLLSLILNIFYFSEPRQKVPTFKLKIKSPAKNSPPMKGSDKFLMDKSRRTLFESGGDGISKSSTCNTNRLVEEKVEQKIKNYVDLEWSLMYVDEDGILLLIFAKVKARASQSWERHSHLGKFTMSNMKIVT